MAAYSDFRAVSGATDASLDFLASHPNAPQRIDLAQRHARQFGAPGIGQRDRDSFLAGIDGLLFGDTPDEGYVRGNTFLHPKLGISFSVPHGFVIDNTAAAVTATGPGDMAIRFDGVTHRQQAVADRLCPQRLGGRPRPCERAFGNGQRQRSRDRPRQRRGLAVRHHGDPRRRPGLPAADRSTDGQHRTSTAWPVR